MTLTPDDIRVIAQAVKEAMDEKHATFWIEAEQHYLDHQQLAECRQTRPEWIENHKFVSEIRETKAFIKRTSIKLIVASVVGAIISWVALHFHLLSGK